MQEAVIPPGRFIWPGLQYSLQMEQNTVISTSSHPSELSLVLVVFLFCV